MTAPSTTTPAIFRTVAVDVVGVLDGRCGLGHGRLVLPVPADCGEVGATEVTAAIQQHAPTTTVASPPRIPSLPTTGHHHRCQERRGGWSRRRVRAPANNKPVTAVLSTTAMSRRISVAVSCTDTAISRSNSSTAASGSGTPHPSRLGDGGTLLFQTRPSDSGDEPFPGMTATLVRVARRRDSLPLAKRCTCAAVTLPSRRTHPTGARAQFEGHPDSSGSRSAFAELLGDQLGDLGGVERRALAEVVAAHEQVERVGEVERLTQIRPTKVGSEPTTSAGVGNSPGSGSSITTTLGASISVCRASSTSMSLLEDGVHRERVRGHDRAPGRRSPTP